MLKSKSSKLWFLSPLRLKCFRRLWPQFSKALKSIYYLYFLILVELFMWIILNQSPLIFLLQNLHDRWADELINPKKAVDGIVLQKLSSAALEAWGEDVCHPRSYSAISLQLANRNLDGDFQCATWKFPTTAHFLGCSGAASSAKGSPCSVSILTNSNTCLGRNAACLQPFHLKSCASDSSIWHSQNEDEIEPAEK